MSIWQDIGGALDGIAKSLNNGNTTTAQPSTANTDGLLGKVGTVGVDISGTGTVIAWLCGGLAGVIAFYFIIKSLFKR